MRNSDRGFRPKRGNSRSFGRSNDRFDGSRRMYDATCDNCGKPCKVPFQPTSGKPVYCSDCFEKMGGQGSPRPERSNFRPRNGGQMEAISAKLDKIIELLTPKEVK